MQKQVFVGIVFIPICLVISILLDTTSITESDSKEDSASPCLMPVVVGNVDVN